MALFSKAFLDMLRGSIVSSPAKPRERRKPGPGNSGVLWNVLTRLPNGIIPAKLEVRARTKSEARAEAKKAIGVPREGRLSVGTTVVRVK